MIYPKARLSHLHRADGSAQYSANGYTVVGAVNGPIEVQRRDELAEESTIEVNVRPDAGVGTTMERHLEDILHTNLRAVILTYTFPRTLIQVTLQITQKPQIYHSKFSSSSVPLLPALLQTAMLTLLSGSIPLAATYTAIGLAENDGSISILNQKSLESATSIHAFAFTSNGEMLLSESEGIFSIDIWELVAAKAKELCCADPKNMAERMDIDNEDNGQPLHAWLKDTLQQKTSKDQAWKT